MCSKIYSTAPTPSQTPYNFNTNFNCLSVDENYFSNLNSTSSLFIVSLNVQGLLAKKDKLISFLANLCSTFKLPDVLVLQETWLDSSKEPPQLLNYHQPNYKT